MNRLRTLTTIALFAAAFIAAGCGGSSGGSSAGKAPNPNAKETSPPGDIPDNQAFVAYAGSGFTVKVPEGWARKTTAAGVTFTDKLNSVAIARPTAAKAPAVRGGHTSTVSRAGGKALRTKYPMSGATDPVTGKTHRNDVERYDFSRGGKHVVLTLSGAHGADNVDPWKIITNSFRWTR